MSTAVLRIGEVARRTGLAASALRYYEQAGLLGPISRTEAGYRLFDARIVGRLRFVQRAKQLGLSLEEIRALIESPAIGVDRDRQHVRHVVAHKLAETKTRIAELNELRQELETLYLRLLRGPGPECGHLGDCECWLPTDQEVTAMTSEIAEAEESACSCCGCDDPGCPCGCPCCGGAG